MSTAPRREEGGPHGTNLLPGDLADEVLDALPVLTSLGDLEIEDLTDDEYEKFIAALSS